MTSWFRVRRRGMGWLFASATILLLPSCKPPEPSVREQKSPTASSAQASAPPTPAIPRVENVVLITIDALRADQPWSGYSKIATPHLSRLAAKSIVYSRAYSLAHLTTASLSGLLASRYPSELERNSCDFGSYEIPESLAPTLKAAGVRTFAAHGHAIFVGDSAPRRGFDEWRLIRGAAGRLQADGAVTGADIARLLTTYLEKERPKTRLFAWAHFVDPHDSYVAHKDFPPSSTEPRDLYDSEVAYTDSVVGSVLESIDRAGMAATTAIVLTADHGEAFGEHGTMRHGSSLHDEEVHVPLMLYLPGVEPRKIDVPRSAVDVAPTIAELFSVKTPASWVGVSLLKDVNGSKVVERPVVIDVPGVYGRPSKQAVVRGSTKVLMAGSPRAYDLATDPAERTPLSSDAARAPIAIAREDLKRLRSIPDAACVRAKGGRSKVGI